jgi:multidrug efflux system membrane fusion protein
MPVQLAAIGSVEAYSTIQVKAQVSGALTQVLFNEGDVVGKDQTLFVIDPRPHQVALEQAEAGLARARAQLEQARANLARDQIQAANAQVDLDRDAALLPKGMVSKEEFDNVRTNAETLKAAVTADEAAVKSDQEAIRSAQAAIEDAKLQLGYCTIGSPIQGRTGSLLINRGNLVKANDAASLVVINQTAPIYVSFTVPEKDLSAIREHMAQGALEVKAIIPQQEDKPVTGKLTFIDNTVNQTTGTIRLKATFPNEDNRLWPGQFVNVTLQLTVQADAIVVPAEAVQTGQAGPYAYVIKPDMTAELRNLVVGDTQNSLTIIKEGLEPDDKVVTDGHLRVVPDVPVKILSEPGAEEKK